MWAEILSGFRWWMIPFSILLLVLGFLFLVLVSPDDLMPHEYEVH
jgi:hypothetical protein